MNKQFLEQFRYNPLKQSIQKQEILKIINIKTQETHEVKIKKEEKKKEKKEIFVHQNMTDIDGDVNMSTHFEEFETFVKPVKLVKPQIPIKEIKKRKPLGAAKREQVWEVYAKKFILKYKNEKWFHQLNPPDRIYTTITCWCCAKILISERGYGSRSLFEAGHVNAHCFSKDDSITNLRPICRNCNLKMGTSHMLEFAKYMGYQSEITKE